MSCKRFVLVAILSLCVQPAFGQRGGSSSTGGGTIYFSSSGTMFTMNSDGTNKSALPAGVQGVPSRQAHGGHTWFVTMVAIPGESYPGSHNGNPTRREIGRASCRERVYVLV